MIDLSICIVTMNHKKVFEYCLKSIENNPPENYSYEIVVVDNCSSDSIDEVVFKYKDLLPITFIKNYKRLNFSENNNICMRKSRGRYYLILNPDTIIFSQTLDYMISFMDNHPKIGASSCKLLYNDKSFQENCRRFPKLSYVISNRLNSLGISIFNKTRDKYIQCSPNDISPKPVDWIIGAFMLLRRSTITEVGMFDERFTLYFEDTDLCFRIWEKGWEVFYVPQVSIIHLYERSASKSLLNKKAVIQIYTLILFYFKNYFKMI